jgi:hypothetical protein
VLVLYTHLFTSELIPANPMPQIGRPKVAKTLPKALPAGSVAAYGGTVDKFTGDGIMALSGASVALEDHALRGCVAALNIQKETARLAAEVERRDGIGSEKVSGTQKSMYCATRSFSSERPLACTNSERLVSVHQHRRRSDIARAGR